MLDVPDYPFARDPERPLDPPAEYRAYRAGGALPRVRVWDGSTPWLITRYDDARRALVDRRFSVDATLPGFPHVSPASWLRSRGVLPFQLRSDQDYALQRPLFAAEFTPQRMAGLRPFVQRVADEEVDSLASRPRPVDLIEHYALPFATRVICELLGVPDADRGRLHELSRVIGSRTAPAEVVTTALAEMNAYFFDIVADPGDAMIGRFVRSHVHTGMLPAQDAAASLLGVFFAGHGPTAYMIAMGFVALDGNRDQVEVLTGGDRAARSAAVQELLRYVTVSHNGRQRVATEDVVVGGTVIRAGEGVLIQVDSANRDEAAFPHPDGLDLTRVPKRNLALGAGVHHCMGHVLAGVELDVAFTTLYRRLPALRLALPVAEVPFKNDENLLGAHELLVTW